MSKSKSKNDTTTTKEEKKTAAVAEEKPAKDTPALSAEEEAVKQLVKDLRIVEAKRRLYRRTLIQYDRIKKRFTTQLDKLATPEDKSESPEKDTVVAVYRLVRNFCISVNTLTMTSAEDDKQVFPAKFAGELKTALGSPAVVDAFTQALKAEKAEDSTAVLPAKIDAKVTKAVTAFLEKHDKTEVTAKLEAELDTLTKSIDSQREVLKGKRAEISKTRPEKPAKPVSKSVEKRSASSKKAKKPAKKEAEPSMSTEERFRNLVQEVNSRVSKIHLEKDDHKVYSDVQAEIDSFLSEAISDILAIKTNLKKRWEAVQSGKTGKTRQRSRSRQARPRTRAPRKESGEAAHDGGQQSVFSKAQQL